MVVGGSAFPLNYFYLFFFSDFSFNSKLKKKKKKHLAESKQRPLNQNKTKGFKNIKIVTITD